MKVGTFFDCFPPESCLIFSSMRAICIVILCIIQCLSCKEQAKGENTLNLAGLIGLGYLAGTTISCTTAQLQKTQANRIFTTGFESSSEFSSFYSVPTNYQSAATHEISAELKRGGSFAHKANIFAPGPSCVYPVNCNHRGYPTIQLHKLPAGGFKTPVLVEYYAYLDMNFPRSDDWFSFATFSADASDAWRRVILINTDAKGKAVLTHVPVHNQSNVTFQNASVTIPKKNWVKITACLNFDPDKGQAKVWQDDVLVSTAEVKGACGVLEQAHFGLYASPTLSQGTIYNDDLVIREVSVCP